MNCECCELEHDGTYGSGRFCCKVCARAFSTKSKRKEINEKVSEKLKGKPSWNKGKKGKKLTEEQRERFLEGVKRYNEQRPKVSEAQKKAKNVANVIAYRARKRNAIIETTDLDLIKKIYESCPEGYEVDHIHSLSTGGLHHQDNLQYLPKSENCRKGAARDYDRSLAVDWRPILAASATSCNSVMSTPNGVG